MCFFISFLDKQHRLFLFAYLFFFNLSVEQALADVMDDLPDALAKNLIGFTKSFEYNLDTVNQDNLVNNSAMVSTDLQLS